MLYRVLVLLVTCLMTLPVTAQQVLKLAADDWPPFTGSEAGSRVATDLVELALRNRDYLPQTELMSWAQVREQVSSGERQGAIAVWDTPARREGMVLSRAILENRIKAVSMLRSGLAIRSLEDLAGLKVAAVAGYAYGPELEAVVKAARFATESDSQSIQLLLSGEADVALLDDLSMRSIRSQLDVDAAAGLIVHHANLAIRSMHFGLRNDVPNVEQVIQDFNDKVELMMADGSYNDILRMPWIAADTDRDGVLELIGSKTSLDLADPPMGAEHYQLFGDELAFGPNRVYRVGNQQYSSLDDARAAISQESLESTSRGDEQQPKAGISVAF
jgi:ABC-type amino acid transport substrate-binding protein